jgi:hypothetical protein
VKATSSKSRHSTNQSVKESVLAKFGPGYYILKVTKPRFKTVWKQHLGEIERTKEFHNLKKRTKYLTYGVAGLRAIQAVGLGLTHLRFSGLEQSLDKIKMLLQTPFKPEGLWCGNCGKPLDFLLQDFCSQCGTAIDWPRRPPPTKADELAVRCFKCKSPLLKHQIYRPHLAAWPPSIIARQFEIQGGHLT